MEAVSLREAGEERAGYPKGQEPGETGNKVRNIAQSSQQENYTEVGTTREGGRNQAYKVGEARNSEPPPPLPR